MQPGQPPTPDERAEAVSPARDAPRPGAEDDSTADPRSDGEDELAGERTRPGGDVSDFGVGEPARDEEMARAVESGAEPPAAPGRGTFAAPTGAALGALGDLEELLGGLDDDTFGGLDDDGWRAPPVDAIAASTIAAPATHGPAVTPAPSAALRVARHAARPLDDETDAGTALAAAVGGSAVLTHASGRGSTADDPFGGEPTEAERPPAAEPTEDAARAPAAQAPALAQRARTDDQAAKPTSAVTASARGSASHAAAATPSTQESASHAAARAVTPSAQASPSHAAAHAVTPSAQASASHAAAHAVTPSAQASASHAAAATPSAERSASHAAARAVTPFTNAPVRDVDAARAETPPGSDALAPAVRAPARALERTSDAGGAEERAAPLAPAEGAPHARRTSRPAPASPTSGPGPRRAALATVPPLDPARVAELDALHRKHRPARSHTLLGSWALSWLRPVGPAAAESLPRVKPREVCVTFGGHATALVRYPQVTIACDPMLGRWVGAARRAVAPGLTAGDLAAVDLVLITHATPDHLHRPTLAALDRGATVVVPPRCAFAVSDLGFARVVELGVGQALVFRGVDVTSVPVAHARGAAPGCAYVLRGDGPSVFFCGDGGYSGVFAEVGARYRPDLALLPIGGYVPRSLRADHMSPLDAIYAFGDLGARMLVPIRHGAFQLSYETLDEPVAWLRRLVADRDLESFVTVLAPGASRKFVLP